MRAPLLAVRLGFELEAEADVAKAKPASSATSVANIVQRGRRCRKVLQVNGLDDQPRGESRNLLISCGLQALLAALDDFRNWLIREAA